MAVTTISADLDADLDAFHPRWPTRGIDPARVWEDYDPVADELLVFFGGKPVGAVNVPINTPERDYVDLLVDEETDDVVGLQVDALVVWVGAANPRWAPLADVRASAEQRREAVAALIADAAGLFALHGVGGA